MPMVLEAIDHMTVTEKVNVMEYVWNALVSEHSAPTPDWHGDVLVSRREKMANGEETYLSVEESEACLEESCCAR